VGVENSAQVLGHNGSGDLGVDVMADDDGHKRLIVSCKRYGGKVGPDEIKILHMDLQKLSGQRLHDGRVLVGVLVTTVGFTAGAQALAQDLGIAILTIEALRDQAEKHFLY
jgi:restriction endonuclease Mrr